MKKIKIFLIIIICILLKLNINVYAEQTTFYEGEYIPGIWMNKVKNNTIYYQTARFFRQSGTNNFAYCIEPFEMFNENNIYVSTLTPYNLTEQQRTRISLIAHFGYGYYNHYETKWYAITQMMIWQESDPSGKYYFTDKLNGKRIDIFTNEMNEINNLINNYNTNPSITNETYNIVEDEQIIINDNNNVINNYIVDNYKDNIIIKDNKIIINNLKENNYQINLSRNDNFYNKPIIFYENNNTQNLVETGDINKNISFNINVKKTQIEITKIDKDTKTTIPSGEGQLENTTYKVYDNKMNEITKIIIDENMKGKIDNLLYGKYYIKEDTPGIGYQLDNNIYEIDLNKNNNIKKLILENEIIKKEIIINKLYGDEVNMNNESNILFEIYDINNILINTIKTDINGKAIITLPYGTYTIKQINTTEGYNKSNDITINIKDTEKETINIYDYKIKVPNTKIKDNKNIFIIIITILYIIYVKKRIYN